MLCFADLKRYKFTYLFGFPALHSVPSWKVASTSDGALTAQDPAGNVKRADAQLTGHETAALVDCVQTWRYGADARQHGFFLAKRVRHGKDGETKQLRFSEEDADSRLQPLTSGTPGQELGYVWGVSSLASYEDGFFMDVEPEDRFVCFADPSTYADHPGWMLRNLLVLIRQRWALDFVRILCYRDIPSRRDEARSIVLDLSVVDAQHISAAPAHEVLKDGDMPKVTGWERNRTGRVTSKVANLGEYMDPLRYVLLPACWSRTNSSLY